MHFNREQIIRAKKALEGKIGNMPLCGIILGSGLSDIVRESITAEIPFEEINGLGISKVPEHRNKFVLIDFKGRPVLVAQGRLHMYEGFSAFEAAFPVAIMGEMGIKNIILTNAAGGIKHDFRVGDLMAVTDHINLQAASPLTAMPGSEKFIDMSHAYDRAYLAELTGKFGIQSGVYAGVLGPQFETPAEIRFLRTIGADAVGMSTVMEAIMAKYYQMRLFGFSLITNKAAGMGEDLSHVDVMKAAKIGGGKLWQIIEFLLDKI